MKPGERISRYEVVSTIYEGAYCNVYRVRHRVLQRDLVLKLQQAVVPDEIPDSMVLEAQLQARIAHRNVLAVFDAFEVDQRVAIVLEYVRTQSLADLLENRTLPLRAGVGLFKGIVRGVRALHVHNIVHRDLKPENILLAKEEGRVVPKVADFGMAKLLEPGRAPEAQHLSRSFSFLGTPEYMAPEQAKDPGSVDTRADLFSLGCLLYELVTHRVCFEAPTPLDVLYKAAKRDYLPIDQAIGDAPPGLSNLVDRLLHPVPAKRVPDCDTLLRELDQIRT